MEKIEKVSNMMKEEKGLRKIEEELISLHILDIKTVKTLQIKLPFSKEHKFGFCLESLLSSFWASFAQEEVQNTMQ